jgi:site-specific recombinase XerD
MKLPGRPTLYRLQGPFEASILNIGTWSYYARALDRLIEFFGKDREPNDITREETKNYLAWLHDKYNLSERTITQHRRIASSFYKWMFLCGIDVTINPFAADYMKYRNAPTMASRDTRHLIK